MLGLRDEGIWVFEERVNKQGDVHLTWERKRSNYQKQKEVRLRVSARKQHAWLDSRHSCQHDKHILTDFRHDDNDNDNDNDAQTPENATFGRILYATIVHLNPRYRIISAIVLAAHVCTKLACRILS